MMTTWSKVTMYLRNRTTRNLSIKSIKVKIKKRMGVCWEKGVSKLGI